MTRTYRRPLLHLAVATSTVAMLNLLGCSSAEEKDDPAPTQSAQSADADAAAGEAAEETAEAGPIDGTWAETTLTCDGEANPKIPQITLNVSQASGTFGLGFGPTCAATIPESYSYSGDVVTITPQSVSCAPNEGCGEVFGGAECLPGPPPATDFTFSVSGDTLSLTKTSGGPPADNCAAGAEEVYTMKKQG